MSEPAIYPGSTPPPRHVACIVGWNGRQFRAVRVLDPKSRRVLWATYVDGEARYLPPRRGADRWGDHPDWWRPEHTATYPGVLPAPIEDLARPRLVSEPRAEVADDVGSDDAKRGAWWLDPGAIAYSPPGEISRHEAEGRIMRAVSISGAGRGLGLRGGEAGAILAAIAEAADLALGDGDALAAIVPRFEAMPADLDDWLTAMAWFSALDPPRLRHKRRDPWSLNRRQRMLVWRSGVQPVSFAEIGHQISRSASAARQTYVDAIDRVHGIANAPSRSMEYRRLTPVEAL